MIRRRAQNDASSQQHRLRSFSTTIDARPDNNNNNNNADDKTEKDDDYDDSKGPVHVSRWFSSMVSHAVTVVACVFLLFSIADLLDSSFVAGESRRYGPNNVDNMNNNNNRNTNNAKTVATIGEQTIDRALIIRSDAANIIAHDSANAIGNAIGNANAANGERATTTKKTKPPPSIEQLSVPPPATIPFVRYDPIGFKEVRARMDHAFSIGDTDNPNNPNNTIGQRLLDFGIIGFPKCGTSSMMLWLNGHDNIAVLTKENMALQKRHPALILRHIQNNLPEGRYRRGYKSPNDIEDERARNKLATHYPQTRLLVGIRHPVLWFESFYNHRVQNGYPMPDLPDRIRKKAVFTICDGNFRGACLVRSNFHVALAKWGKTPLLNPFSTPEEPHGYESFFRGGNNFNNDNNNYSHKDEWKHFSKTEARELRKVALNKTVISPNPMFLYDVGQLRDPNPSNDRGYDNDNDKKRKKDDYENFVLSLQEYLGVEANASAMPPMVHMSPGKILNATEQDKRDALKIDICDEELGVARDYLIKVGADVASWITNYLAKSPHGVYFGGDRKQPKGGSPSLQAQTQQQQESRFLKILESYGRDPCPERRLQKEKQRRRQRQQQTD